MSSTTTRTSANGQLAHGFAPELMLELANEGLRRGDEGDRMAAFFLAELVDTRGHKALGYGSVRRLLEEGTRHSVAHGKKLIKIGRALRKLPEIELAEIVTRAASARGFVLTPEGAERLATASRETPRRALKLLEAVRDEAAVARTEVVGVALVERALAREEVDLAGLDRVERAYVGVLEEARGPVGLKTIAALLGMSEAQLESSHEPELLRRGWVQITPAGRVLGSAVRARRVEVPMETKEVPVKQQATA